MVTHSSFLSGAIYQAKHGAMITQKSRVLQLASTTFDVFLMEILSALVLGACVCIPSSLSLSSAVGIPAAVQQYRATWMFLTPSLAKLVDPASVPTLQVLVLGGEAPSREDVQKWADSLQLANGYGPSGKNSQVVSFSGLSIYTFIFRMLHCSHLQPPASQTF